MYDVNQVVTIMGAHSLGGAKANNSGYRGKWTGAANPGFSELFYYHMLNSSISWKNVVGISEPNVARLGDYFYHFGYFRILIFDQRGDLRETVLFRGLLNKATGVGNCIFDDF